jgi:hypothetical protein
VGENPPGGAVIYYSLKSHPQGDVTIEFLDSAGKSVNKYSSRPPAQPAEAPAPELEEEGPPRGGAAPRVGRQRRPESLRVEPALSRRHQLPRPHHVGRQPHRSDRPPGVYTVKLTVDGKTQTRPSK